MSDKKNTITAREINCEDGKIFFSPDGSVMSAEGKIKISERIVTSGESLGEMMAQFASMGIGAPLSLTGPAESPAPLRLTGPAGKGAVFSVSALSDKREVNVAALEEAFKARPPKTKPQFDGKPKMCTSAKCETRALGDHKMVSEICVLGCRKRYQSVLKNGRDKCNCVNIHGGAHCTAEMGDHSTHQEMCLCAKFHKEAIEQAIAHVNQIALEKGQHASRLDLPASASTPDRRPGVTTLTRDWQSRINSEKKMQQSRQQPASREVEKSEYEGFSCPSMPDSLMASVAAGLQSGAMSESDGQGYLPAHFEPEEPVDPDMLVKIHAQAQAQAQAQVEAEAEAETDS